MPEREGIATASKRRKSTVPHDSGAGKLFHHDRTKKEATGATKEEHMTLDEATAGQGQGQGQGQRQGTVGGLQRTRSAPELAKGDHRSTGTQTPRESIRRPRARKADRGTQTSSPSPSPPGVFSSLPEWGVRGGEALCVALLSTLITIACAFALRDHSNPSDSPLSIPVAHVDDGFHMYARAHEICEARAQVMQAVETPYLTLFPESPQVIRHIRAVEERGKFVLRSLLAYLPLEDEPCERFRESIPVNNRIAASLFQNASSQALKKLDAALFMSRAAVLQIEAWLDGEQFQRHNVLRAMRTLYNTMLKQEQAMGQLRMVIGRSIATQRAESISAALRNPGTTSAVS